MTLAGGVRSDEFPGPLGSDGTTAPRRGEERRNATATSAATQPSGTYADVNGLHLYYEIEGTGRPLILIHGGRGSEEMFGPVRTALAASQ
jgi:hypothetical protein